jgi:hypothetical protein
MKHITTLPFVSIFRTARLVVIALSIVLSSCAIQPSNEVSGEELVRIMRARAVGIPPVAASAQPFTISTDGREVTDQRTGLIWRRCTEGMVFSGGTCAGTASTFTHGAALQHAAAQAGSTGIAWRLPNIKELSSIADKSFRDPAIDPIAFPATPASQFWSASSVAGGIYGAWYVYFGSGGVGDWFRFTSYHVRLVRDGQ